MNKDIKKHDYRDVQSFIQVMKSEYSIKYDEN